MRLELRKVLTRAWPHIECREASGRPRLYELAEGLWLSQLGNHTKQGLPGTVERRLGQEVVQKHPLFQVQIRKLLADGRKQACAGVGSGGGRAGM